MDPSDSKTPQRKDIKGIANILGKVTGDANGLINLGDAAPNGMGSGNRTGGDATNYDVKTKAVKELAEAVATLDGGNNAPAAGGETVRGLINLTEDVVGSANGAINLGNLTWRDDSAKKESKKDDEKAKKDSKTPQQKDVKGIANILGKVTGDANGLINLGDAAPNGMGSGNRTGGDANYEQKTKVIKGFAEAVATLDGRNNAPAAGGETVRGLINIIKDVDGNANGAINFGNLAWGDGSAKKESKKDGDKDKEKN